MNFTVKSPGSCGELVQGTLDGQPFLITCPINLYSLIRIFPVPGELSSLAQKSRQALTLTLKYLNFTDSPEKYALHWRFQHISELPVGKGMASSSADISAVCQAVAWSQGKELSPDELADLCLAIEPTDGIFYPGIVVFDHVAGKIRRTLGEPPNLFIAVFDAGGQVDTLSFNRRSDLALLNQCKEPEVREALQLVETGIKQQNIKLIGQGATISALANQAILNKPCLETVIRISSRYDGVGVNVAHSGTVLGVLFAPNKQEQIKACIQEIEATCPKVKYLQTVRLIGGGIQVERGEFYGE